MDLDKKGRGFTYSHRLEGPPFVYEMGFFVCFVAIEMR